jgi:hypothetical protein
LESLVLSLFVAIDYTMDSFMFSITPLQIPYTVFGTEPEKREKKRAKKLARKEKHKKV